MNSQTPKIPPADRANPLLAEWTTPFEVPPFEAIAPEHFPPAFDHALAAHNAEIDAIAADPAKPTFKNTIEALELSGEPLSRVSDVFDCLAGAHTNDAIQAVERDMSPRLAAHFSRIYLHGGLFGRIEALWNERDRLGLSPEQMRVLQRYRTSFRRSGAHLDEAARTRLKAISERLASLGTAFSQNVLADERGYFLTLESEDDLAGLPDFVRADARAAAEARKLPGKHVITLSRSMVEPFLQFSKRRDLREKLFRAFTARGDGGGATDNKALIAEMLDLRAERARLLGYGSFAEYRLEDSMAKTPRAVNKLLNQVWGLARVKALADRDDLQKLIAEEGGNFKLAPWDWRYYAEKLRKIRHDIDEESLKPYFQLDRIIEASFDTANKLFGLSFKERKDVKGWHPDVRVWEVTGEGGRFMGLFFGDYFARSSKQSGAWMTSLRNQEKLAGDIRPLIVNVMNFSKAAEGQPSLLSYDDARTLFHEFGHALHGLLSDVTYPRISGTSVFTDFVELPSQLYEHWFERPEVLRRFALHSKTGEPIPEALLKKLLDARTFDQGCTTLEYVSSALIDMEFHALKSADKLDVDKFERDELARIEMPDEIVMRHRPPHFGHIFSGGGYAAGYYSYMWSEVLDSDAFRAFEETGDIFDPATAKKLRDHIYSAGGSRDPEELYIAFRGKLPTPDALLERRGLVDAAGDA